MKAAMRERLWLLLLFLSVGWAAQQPSSPREQLNQFVADLQRNPYDDTLREKIIRLALELKPPPAVPEEAKRRMARGAAALKGATSRADFVEAAAEFEKATLAAPWMADAYYNLGVARSKAEDYRGAARSLKFYLLAAPDAPDAEEARNLMYEMEYKQEKLEKERTRREEEERARRGAEEAAARAKRESFEGKWFRVDWGPEHLYMTVSRTTTGLSVTKNLESPVPVTGTQPSKVWVEGNTLYWLEVWYWNNPPDRYRFDCKLSLDGSELSCTLRGYGDNFTRPRGSLTLSRR